VKSEKFKILSEKNIHLIVGAKIKILTFSSSLEPYLKRVGFEDKGQGFPKKLFFYCSKSTTAAAAANLRKTAVLTLSSKKGQKKKKFQNFF
jgi:hypothetical protein